MNRYQYSTSNGNLAGIGGIMGITIIMLGITVLLLSGFFFGSVLTVNPEQKESEDKEQMEWVKKYQEAKV